MMCSQIYSRLNCSQTFGIQSSQFLNLFVRNGVGFISIELISRADLCQNVNENVSKLVMLNHSQQNQKRENFDFISIPL